MRNPTSPRVWPRSDWVWWILLLAVAGPCWAQDVILFLRNGDRITGRLLSESTNAVAITTPFADTLSVPKSLIDHREPAPAAAATNQPAASKQPLVPATGVVSELVLTNKTTAGQSATNAVAAKPPPSAWRQFLSEWHGEVQLGANLGFSTLDREAFTGHAKFTETHKFEGGDTALRNIFEYDMSYGKSDHVLSDNRMEGDFKTEYELSKRFLIYNAAVAGYDKVRSIDFQYDLGPGVGYKWIVLTNFVFKTEIGGDYQEQYLAQHDATSRYALRLDEDSWWQITPKIRWDQKVEVFPELDQLGQYRVRAETNLSYLLKQNLTLTLNVVDQYDTGLPSDVSKNDLQIRSLLGIKF